MHTKKEKGPLPMAAALPLSEIPAQLRSIPRAAGRAQPPEYSIGNVFPIDLLSDAEIAEDPRYDRFGYSIAGDFAKRSNRTFGVHDDRVGRHTRLGGV